MPHTQKHHWLSIADTEASALVKALPAPLRERLSNVSISFANRPSGSEILEDGDEEELLGLFLGLPVGEEGANAEVSPEIRLFLDNIYEEADGDEAAFRQEVRTTLLHEIGHYLGLDEDDLDLRGLS